MKTSDDYQNESVSPTPAPAILQAGQGVPSGLGSLQGPNKPDVGPHDQSGSVFYGVLLYRL